MNTTHGDLLSKVWTIKQAISGSSGAVSSVREINQVYELWAL